MRELKLLSKVWIAIFICFALPAVYTYVEAEEYTIAWDDDADKLNFTGASFSAQHQYLPVFSIIKEGNWKGTFRVHESRLINLAEFKDVQFGTVPEDWSVSFDYGQASRKEWTQVEVLPFRRMGDRIELLVSFSIDFTENNIGKRARMASQKYSEYSKLSSGVWYKFGVNESGVYKLDASFFEKLGAKSENIQSDKIKIYGHRGGMLPELSGAERTDDIREIPIEVKGSGHEVTVTAYLEGPEEWTYSEDEERFVHIKNLYTDTKNYFITFEGEQGQRVKTRNEVSAPHSVDITSYDDYKHYEEDINNLLASGRIWLGHEIGAANQLVYNFNFPDIIQSSPAIISLGLAAKSSSLLNSFQVRTESFALGNVSIPPTGTSTLANAANYAKASYETNQVKPGFSVIIDYNRPDYSAKAWPDFITAQVVRELVYRQNNFSFRSLTSVDSNTISQFRIKNWNSNLTLWDVTDLFNIQQIKTSDGVFKAETSVLREFAVFDSPKLTPIPFGRIENQNLHGLKQVDYLIVTRESFIPYAKEIGEFHLEHEGLTYHVVDVEEIFNEFSSGNNDLSAIRNFAKMFYDRALNEPGTAPKYLLLFGSGNYDNKELGEFLLPSYQSPQSFEEVVTYVTDDYFGFLDDSEGDNIISTTTHYLDIAIGRIPADSHEKAQDAVDKVKRYYSSESYGDWRATTAFIADDEDNNIHIRDTDLIANIVQNNYADFNVSKIYLDAFKQQSVSGGHRYPDVTEAINNGIYKGLFYLNFVGHGGPNGLTHEKVITFNEINNWNNKDKLFLFCTATCEFTRFDIPTRYSAGERVLLKRDGGAIALVSTTRLVFSDKNKTINENFVTDLFENSGSGNVVLGDVFLKTKNRTNTRENNRKFALFGDPALKLAFPQNEVVTTELLSYNTPTDTIKSLDKLTIRGEVRKNNTLAQDFDGIVHVSVFDKMIEQSTIGNDASSPVFKFKTRNSIVYRGRAKAKGGKFELTFIVPKDINYNFGNAKLSYYGENEQWDAIGHDFDVTIGGVADSVPQDNAGPLVEVYIDDENFVFGGMAEKNSMLYVKLEDESGINTSGTGLGHDITAILNEDSKNPIILNTFYEEEVGDFTKGAVKYPFNDLEDGRYKINVKAWDVLNNSGEGYTEFIVEDNPNMALYYVLNYPNPFTTNTQFSFEHNRPGDFLDIRIEIYTVNGKLVKTLQTSEISESRRFNKLNWDGLDEYGDKIGKGVYIYKVTVKDSSGRKAHKYQKLVLLR